MVDWTNQEVFVLTDFCRMRSEILVLQYTQKVLLKVFEFINLFPKKFNRLQSIFTVNIKHIFTTIPTPPDIITPFLTIISMISASPVGLALTTLFNLDAVLPKYLLCQPCCWESFDLGFAHKPANLLSAPSEIFVVRSRCRRHRYNTT